MSLCRCHAAAGRYRVAAADVTVVDGRVHVPGRDPMPIVELVQAALGRLRGEVIGNGVMRKVDMPEHPLGGEPAFSEFNCTAFEVEVDTETGGILMHKHITVADVCKALNPQLVESQDEGAAIMGLGHTLMEHILLDDAGRIRNLGALDYRIPTTKDVPLELHALGVETPPLPLRVQRSQRGRPPLHCTRPRRRRHPGDRCRHPRSSRYSGTRVGKGPAGREVAPRWTSERQFLGLGAPS